MESSNETARLGSGVSGGGKAVSLMLPLLLLLLLLVSLVSEDAAVTTARGEEGDGGSTLLFLVSVALIKAASGADNDSVPGRGGRSSFGFMVLMS